MCTDLHADVICLTRGSVWWNRSDLTSSQSFEEEADRLVFHYTAIIPRGGFGLLSSNLSNQFGSHVTHESHHHNH